MTERADSSTPVKSVRVRDDSRVRCGDYDEAIRRSDPQRHEYRGTSFEQGHPIADRDFNRAT